MKPHDLRRHAATYASRSGVPMEIVSKVILRHANLSTTQRYLGTVSDIEAMRWTDTLEIITPHNIFTVTSLYQLDVKNGGIHGLLNFL